MTITVEYPIMEKVIIKTEAEAKAMGYKKEIAQFLPVNRPYHVPVKQTARKIEEMFMSAEDSEKELTAMCLEQTGMTPADYQRKHGRAWNE